MPAPVFQDANPGTDAPTPGVLDLLPLLPRIIAPRVITGLEGRIELAGKGELETAGRGRISTAAQMIHEWCKWRGHRREGGELAIEVSAPDLWSASTCPIALFGFETDAGGIC